MLVPFLDLYARMAAQSRLHSCVKPELTQNNPSMWNWTGSRSPPNAAAAADDDAWEARAIAEDAAGGSALMGTTWPPRSYSCTFCRREFKSAQALGGHMNVHRRDRAKLRSVQGADPASSSPTSAAQPIVFPPLPRAPPPEFVANGGILLIYPIGAGAGAVFAPAVASPPSFGSSLPHGEVGRSSSSSPPATKKEGNDGVVVEELDLELRLGR